MARIGTKVIVTDDDGKPHTGVVTAINKQFGPFRSYVVVIDSSGQILNLAPQCFTEVPADG